MEPSKQEKVFQEVMREAWKNPEFKAQLIKNPVQTIQQFSGETMIIPEGKNFKVVDQSNADTIYFNLPANQEVEDVELNEDQLDLISGGGENDPAFGTTTKLSMSNDLGYNFIS